MKNLLLTNLLILLAANAQAATVSIGNINDIYVADTLLGSSSSIACETSQTSANCDFLKTGPTEYLNNSGLEAIVTSDPSTYVLSPFRDSAYFDLGFGSENIYTGEGDDLVVFIVGNTTSFGLDVFDTQGNILNSGTYNVATPTFNQDGSVLDAGDTVFDNDNSWLCVNSTDSVCTGGAALSALFFDIDDNGTEIGYIRILLGEDYNGIAADGSDIRPRFSLAGGFHNSAVVTVPLPAPALLFGSGLALLGWTSKRKK